MKNPNTIPVNWETYIRCTSCKTEFSVGGNAASPSVGLVDPEARTRMILLTVPNECPECHNLRVLKGGG
jgi:hypothetical protein